MKRDLKLFHKALILVAVPLLFELALLSTLAWLLNQSELETARAQRSEKIITTSENLIKEIYFSAMALLAYSTSHSSAMQDQYQTLKARMPQEVDSLLAIAGANSQQRER